MAERQRSGRAWYAGGGGPGAITADGCAVEFYSLLPPGPEPGIVHGAVPEGASILELGAGAGRLTRPLVRLGHPVVAVDDSPEMLARIDVAETVLASIETLDLGRRFDVVLLASFFANAPDDGFLRDLLRACRRHVRDDGCVLLQRHEPGWFDSAAPFERRSGEVTFRMREVSRPEPGQLAATMEYQIGERTWRQWFIARRLDDDALAGALAGAGLALDALLTEDGTWVRARPVSPRPLSSP